MILRRVAAIALSALFPCVGLPASALGATPGPRAAPTRAAEAEDWELEAAGPVEPDAMPTEAEMARLIERGGTLRVRLGGQIYEKSIPAPPGVPLTRDELDLLSRDLTHQEALLRILEKGRAQGAAARAELLAYAKSHRASIAAASAARARLSERLLVDHAALLSVPDALLHRLTVAFDRSAAILAADPSWEADARLTEALDLFTGAVPAPSVLAAPGRAETARGAAR